MRPSSLLLLAAPGSKAAAAAAAKKAARANDAVSGRAVELLSMLARPVFEPPPLSDKERARRRRNMIAYGRLRRADHIADERKANAFLLSKWCAIDALPHKRRLEALNSPERIPPLDVPVWTSTPPIPGFNVGDLTKS